MKHFALGLALCGLIACNYAPKSGSTSDSDSSVSAPSTSDDLYSVLFNEDYTKTETPENSALGFYVFNDDDNSRCFALYESSEVEQHWGITGKLIPVEGKTNKFSFAAKDDFNGFPEVYNGTVEFSRLSNGEINVSFSNTDGKERDFFEYFPKQMNFHKTTDQDRKDSFIKALCNPDGWECADNDAIYVTFDLNNPDMLGSASYSTMSRMDIHSFTAIKSMDFVNHRIVMESVCGRDGDETKVDMEFELQDDEAIILRFKSIKNHGGNEPSDCYLYNADFSLEPVYGGYSNDDPYGDTENTEDLCFSLECLEFSTFDGDAKSIYDGGIQLNCEESNEGTPDLFFNNSGKLALCYNLSNGQYKFLYSVVLCEDEPHGDAPEVMYYNACVVISNNDGIIAYHPTLVWYYSEGLWTPEPRLASFNPAENTLVIGCVSQGIDGQGARTYVLDKNNDIKIAYPSIQIPGVEDFD